MPGNDPNPTHLCPAAWLPAGDESVRVEYAENGPTTIAFEGGTYHLPPGASWAGAQVTVDVIRVTPPPAAALVVNEAMTLDDFDPVSGDGTWAGEVGGLPANATVKVKVMVSYDATEACPLGGSVPEEMTVVLGDGGGGFAAGPPDRRLKYVRRK